MASKLYVARVTDSLLSAGVAKTVTALLPASSRAIKLVRWSVSFDGATSSATPALVELVRQTASPNGTATTFTPLPWDPENTVAAIAGAKITYSAEPTSNLVTLWADRVPVYNGFVERPYAPDERPEVAVSTGLYIRVTAAATVNVTANMLFED